MNTGTPTTKVLTAWAALAVFAVAAPAFADPTCKTIRATHHDVLISGAGCPSPIGFCAGGDEVRGNHGFRGSFFFSALAFDPIPDDPLGRLAVPGVSTYTTADGTLTISDVSAFDVERGTFAGVGRITAGTGRFAGATGDIFTTGRVGADGASFTTEATIDICFAE